MEQGKTKGKTMKPSKTLKLAMAAIAAVGLISTAQAVPVVSVTVGALTVNDSGLLGNPPPGSLTSGSLDGFSWVNLVPGELGTAVLDLTGLTATTTTGGTITFCVLDTVSSLTSPLEANVSASGTPGATFCHTVQVNGGVMFTTTTGVVPGGSNTIFIPVPTGTPFTLENCVTLTLPPGATVSFDVIAMTGVPDSGMTVTLLGLGLLGIGGLAKFRAVKTGS